MNSLEYVYNVSVCVQGMCIRLSFNSRVPGKVIEKLVNANTLYFLIRTVLLYISPSFESVQIDTGLYSRRYRLKNARKAGEKS